ncbi:hypothetical protein ACA910_003625 [Epithemia clementina (nom. ined.)]
MVPDSAIIQENPDRTFADMKHQMSLLSSTSNSLTLTDQNNNDHQDFLTAISIGCGLQPTTGANDDNVMDSSSSSSASVHVRRRRVMQVQTAQACNNVTNFYCWMSCLDIPHASNRDLYLEQGYSLYCMNPHIYRSSTTKKKNNGGGGGGGGDEMVLLQQAVEPCLANVLNPDCMGQWAPTSPNVPAYDLRQGSAATVGTTTSDNYPPGAAKPITTPTKSAATLHIDDTTVSSSSSSSMTTTENAAAPAPQEPAQQQQDDDEPKDDNNKNHHDQHGHPDDRDHQDQQSQKYPQMLVLSDDVTDQHMHDGQSTTPMTTPRPSVTSDYFCLGGTSMYMSGFAWMDRTCVIFLFPGWTLSTPGQFVVACLATVLMGLVLEWILYERRKAVKELPHGIVRTTWAVALYALQLTLGYFLMLVVMTYNGTLFVCSILGLVMGNIIFNRPRSASYLLYKNQQIHDHHRRDDLAKQMAKYRMLGGGSIMRPYSLFDSATIASTATASLTTSQLEQQIQQKISQRHRHRHENNNRNKVHEDDDDDDQDNYCHFGPGERPRDRLHSVLLGGSNQHSDVDDQISSITSAQVAAAAAAIIGVMDASGEVSEGGATPCCHNAADDSYC